MENKTFEELLNELAEIVAQLEKGNLSLEESVIKYQKGMELSLICKKRLEEAKQVIVNQMTEQGEMSFK